MQKKGNEYTDIILEIIRLITKLYTTRTWQFSRFPSMWENIAAYKKVHYTLVFYLAPNTMTQNRENLMLRNKAQKNKAKLYKVW